MPRYIDADVILEQLHEYRKLNVEESKKITADAYRDMDIADVSIDAFYGKLRDLLADLVKSTKYEERIEVIDLMIIYIEEQAKNPKGEYGAGSF